MTSVNIFSKPANTPEKRVVGVVIIINRIAVGILLCCLLLLLARLL